MGYRHFRAGALGAALLATTGLTAPALAQSVNPRFSQVDGNGVDLVTGQFVFSVTEGTIGSGEGALTLRRYVSGSNTADDWTGLLYRRTVGSTTLMHVEFGSIAETFTISGSTYTSTMANGGTLAALGAGQFRYTASDGTQIVYDTDHEEFSTAYAMSAPQCGVADAGTCAIPLSITRPNGMIYTMNWDIETHCDGYDSELNCINPKAFFRFDGVSTSGNYSFSLGYATDSPGSYSAPVPDWYKRTSASFTNLASPPSTLPTSSYSYPSTGVYQLTDTGGRTWRFDSNGGALGIRRPGSSSDDITVSYSGGLVSQVVRDGVTTTYSRSTSGTTLTTTVTAGGNATAVASSTTSGRITAITDALSHTTSFAYDSNGRLTRVTQHEGNYTEYTYDARGNVTQTQVVPKSGSAEPTITTSASYSSSCSNPVVCNLPNSTTDARGNTTDYTYDSTHGGLLTATAPAPTTSATRPETRVTYSQVTAVTGEPVYLPTNVSACQTTSSCNGQADETETNVSYNTSNLLPTSVSSGAGNGSLVATTAATYDSIGNLITVDGPLSGTADTTRFRYNPSRQVIGVIGPDPDGTGSLKHRAQRTTYDGGGRATDVETGTVDSQSDSDWASMSVLQEVEQDYDSNHRPTVQRLRSGSTVYALTQQSYDSLGRLQCVAQRMNPSEFGSLPSDACTLDTTGSYGPDRITRTTYDAVNRPTLVETGVGVSGETANEVGVTYTDNGLLRTLGDANGNTTYYHYDGLDRLQYEVMPHPTTAGWDWTNYRYHSYDAAGNRTYFSQSGVAILYQFDNLNRLTGTNRPGSEPDTTMAYDNLSRLTSVSYTGHTQSFAYDALGRIVTQGGPVGGNYQILSSTYDLAGRRTRLDYGNSLYVDYVYNVAGDMTEVRENGATSGEALLATYAYDNLGRRTSLTRGSGAVTSYTYDNVSRLASIAHDVYGTTYDLTLGYSRNPASQIVSTTRSTDAYAWGGHYAINRSYSANGLNQYTSVGGSTPTYDARGNMTQSAGVSFGYSNDNWMTSAGSNTLAYDSLGRLFQVTASSTTSQFGYDVVSGLPNMVAEYSPAASTPGNGGLAPALRRYVFGAGGEPLVQYEGSGTSTRWWLHADERGSIIALSNGNGEANAINSYDEYGIPAAGNYGRFQYTGQVWMPEAGMYYYRARMYSPTLGRFMQTDPIGYGDGMNIYAYVGNDPVNSTDPLGLNGCGLPDSAPMAVCGRPRPQNPTPPIPPHRHVPTPPEPDGPYLHCIRRGGTPESCSRERPEERVERLVEQERARARHNRYCADRQMDAFYGNLGWSAAQVATGGVAKWLTGERTLASAIRITPTGLAVGVGFAWAQAVWSTRNC